jgi:hypothetical protein
LADRSISEPGREVFIDLERGVRIRYRRSESPPPLQYAITLEVLVETRWTTVRLWDNADAVDEHHEHEYSRSRGKQPPVILPVASVNAAMAGAIEKAGTQWPAIVRRWRGDE